MVQLKLVNPGLSVMAHQRHIQLGTMRLWVQLLALLSGLRICIAMSYGVGHRHGLDLALLWLWHRLATVALIGPIAWEPPCAMNAALKIQKKKNQKKIKIKK